eukprot:evm.model.scf_4157.1 EVM.evm.TU.scf_4157.1   scf_4157:587-7984(-)
MAAGLVHPRPSAPLIPRIPTRPSPSHCRPVTSGRRLRSGVALVARPHRHAESSRDGGEADSASAGPPSDTVVDSSAAIDGIDEGADSGRTGEASSSGDELVGIEGAQVTNGGPLAAESSVGESGETTSTVPVAPVGDDAQRGEKIPRREPQGGRQPPRRISSVAQSSGSVYGPEVDTGFSWEEFMKSGLPKKLGVLLALIAFTRLGVYIRLPGVDVDAFSETMKSSGLLGYVDALSGGSISKVGLFSLGIIPYINASILLQILSAVFPGLKKLQREEGPQGRARFQYIQKIVALAFAVVQAVGQLTYIRPFVSDWSLGWLAVGTLELTAGAAVLIYISEVIGELQLGNGTSLLIFANIASALPSSLGATLQQATKSDVANLGVFGAAFFLTTLGIVYVQEAERRIPMNYASRYRGALQGSSYLPFKVNATGVMPVIFASSILALPSTLARNTDNPVVQGAAQQLYPGGQLYLPVSVALIAFFNWYYTFIQLDPKDVSEQLKKQGASIPDVRPGNATTEYITKTLNRMSVLGSAFLGALAAAPAAVEALTHLTAFRGFAGTSVLILVGVATDTARRVSAEQAMGKYKDIDQLYKDMAP